MLYNGKLYNTISSEHTEIVSTVPPTHNTYTEETYSDGLTWRLRQNTDITTCAVRNVHFKDFYALGTFSSFIFFLESNYWRRSYYPGSIMAQSQNITFEHFMVSPEITSKRALFAFMYGVDNLRLISIDFKGFETGLAFSKYPANGDFPALNNISVILENSYFDLSGEAYIYYSEFSNFAVQTKICNSMVARGKEVKKYDPNNILTIISSDIAL